MSTEPTTALDDAEAALAGGEWERARAAFERALADDATPDAEEGLARALWWLRDPDGGIVHMERAYAGFREAGDASKAARAALWLAREYQAVHGNAAASNGWVARAEGLLRDAGPASEHGWLALTRAERAGDPAEMALLADEALGIAAATGDRDLEAAALARRGYAELAAGGVASGTDRLDEAMAAATGGDVRSLDVVGDITCVAIAAFELSSDWQRIEQWGQVMESWIQNHDDVAVLGFCYACCSELFLASGQWDEAEGMLTQGLGALRAAGHRSRCVHPAAKLAELRLTQGRLEEAEQLLAGYEELPEAAHGIAHLHLARGEEALAAATIHRRLNRIGDDNVLAAPFLAMLVEVQVSQGDLDGADASAARLGRIADASGIDRVTAMADLARGRAGVARGSADAAGALEAALARFASVGMSVEAARARFELARALEADQPEVAVGEARTALAEFERFGAPRDADAAAELLRRHGVKGRTGPKDAGHLTRREQEVLHLVSEGLSNAEIAGRLHLSTKTVGHHVSSVLAKLGVKSRGEAAAWAGRHLRAPEDRAER
ncbi:MAG TPA: response regulator transcription factor [Actinomycetota bacterium]|nr:response regulator transcription factor [Actinomycetota bacterium]